MQQARFTYCPLGKASEKEKKTIEDQEKKQIKAIEDHGKQSIESDKITKKDFNIGRDSVPLEEPKKINKFLEEKSYKFNNLKEKINLNNLIYKYKTEGKTSKDFSNYQNLID